MTRRHLLAGQVVSIERAVWDEDYYAEVHRCLHGKAREAFERAVDAAWREKQATTITPEGVT